MNHIKLLRADGTYVKFKFGDAVVFGVIVEDDIEAAMVEYALNAALHESLPVSFENVGTDEDPVSVKRRLQGGDPGDATTAPGSRAPDGPRKAPQPPQEASQAEAPSHEADSRPQAKEVPVRPSKPTAPQGPWEGMTEEDFAFHELTGWYGKHGMKRKGQMQFAMPQVLILGSRRLNKKQKIKLFCAIATERWTRIRGEIAKDLGKKSIKKIDAKHYEFGSETVGGLFGKLPKAEPMKAHHAQKGVHLPRPVQRPDLTPAAALGMVGDE